MKSRIWILELEDTGLVWSCFEQTRRRVKLLRCSRKDLSSLEPEELYPALEAARREVGFDNGPVNVVLGDRRFVHFDITTPRLDGAELRALVAHEARRRGSLAQDSRIICSLRLINRESRRLHRFGVVALPTAAWDPVAAVLARAHINVVSLTSLEDAMTAALPANASRDAALLEVSGDRARIVAAHDRRVLQVRRFLLPAGRAAASDPSFVATQLALEVPRTQEFFVEQGQAEPQTLIVSHLLHFDEELIGMIGGFADVRVFELPAQMDKESAVPGLATFGALERIRARSVTNILAVAEPNYPLGARGRAFVAACLLLATGLGYGAVKVHKERKPLQAELARINTDLRELQAQESALAVDVEPDRELFARRIEGILERRRPISRLFAEACKLAPEAVHLEELTLVQDSRIEVVGRVDALDRLAGLDAISRYSAALQRLAFLRQKAEDIVPGASGNQLGFKLAFAWRSQ